jgi:hypothetical protein
MRQRDKLIIAFMCILVNIGADAFGGARMHTASTWLPQSGRNGFAGPADAAGGTFGGGTFTDWSLTDWSAGADLPVLFAPNASRRRTLRPLDAIGGTAEAGTAGGTGQPDSGGTDGASGAVGPAAIDPARMMNTLRAALLAAIIATLALAAVLVLDLVRKKKKDDGKAEAPKAAPASATGPSADGPDGSNVFEDSPAFKSTPSFKDGAPPVVGTEPKAELKTEFLEETPLPPASYSSFEDDVPMFEEVPDDEFLAFEAASSAFESAPAFGDNVPAFENAPPIADVPSFEEAQPHDEAQPFEDAEPEAAFLEEVPPFNETQSLDEAQPFEEAQPETALASSHENDVPAVEPPVGEAADTPVAEGDVPPAAPSDDAPSFEDAAFTGAAAFISDLDSDNLGPPPLAADSLGADSLGPDGHQDVLTVKDILSFDMPDDNLPPFDEPFDDAFDGDASDGDPFKDIFADAAPVADAPDSFFSVLREELDRADRQDIVLLSMELANGDLPPNWLIKYAASSEWKDGSRCFQKEGGGVYVIVPGAALDGILTAARDFHRKIRAEVQAHGSRLFIGISARSGRPLDGGSLAGEAERALAKARELAQPIMAFKADPERYKEFKDKRGD